VNTGGGEHGRTDVWPSVLEHIEQCAIGIIEMLMQLAPVDIAQLLSIPVN
jgi:hypothetical protein